MRKNTRFQFFACFSSDRACIKLHRRQKQHTHKIKAKQKRTKTNMMAISTSKRKEMYSVPLHEEEEQQAPIEEENHRPMKRMRRNSSSVQFKTDVSVKEVPPKETYDKNALWYQDETEKEKTKRPMNENIQKLLDAVLDEQIDQWAAGVNNPERLANASKRLSCPYQAKALKDGILDRVAALESK